MPFDLSSGTVTSTWASSFCVTRRYFENFCSSSCFLFFSHHLLITVALVMLEIAQNAFGSTHSFGLEFAFKGLMPVNQVELFHLWVRQLSFEAYVH